MRSSTPARTFAFPALCMLVACHAPQASAVRSEHARERVVDASFRALPGDRDEALPAMADETIADPAIAAIRSLDDRRRVALENLANAHTPAYRRRYVVARTNGGRGAGDSQGPLPEPGPTVVAPVCTQGPLRQTDRQLDVAIEGDGFLAIGIADGSTAYTRAGNLFLNADGKLVTPDGNVVLPEITVPSDTLEMSIGRNGMIGGRTAGSPDTVTLFGQLTLSRFVNPSGLLAMDATIWRASESSGAPVTGQPGMTGLGTLRQGFLEGSNVRFEQELLELRQLEHQHRQLRGALGTSRPSAQ